MKELDTLKEMKNRRDIAEKEGEGQEVKNDAARFSPKSMIYFPYGNRNPWTEPELGIDWWPTDAEIVIQE